MKIWCAFAQFLVGEWIWSVTLAQHQAALAIIILWCSYMYMRIGFVRASLYAFFGQLIAWAILSFVALVVLHGWCGITYNLAEPSTAVGPWTASLLLAGLYTSIHIMMLRVMHAYVPLAWQRMAYAVAWSNIIAAQIVYLLLPPL